MRLPAATTRLLAGILAPIFGQIAHADAVNRHPVFLDRDSAEALANEISGTRAFDDLAAIARHHRMRGSIEFQRAAAHIARELKAAGLAEVEIVALPADGEIYYGTQRSRPAWNARSATLWQLTETNGHWRRDHKIADFSAMPVSLAQDSVSAEVTADLVDVGAGTSEADYAGKDVAGKLVLTSSQPGAAARLAIERFGAVGLVSYAQNQKSAWWMDDDRLVRWGHLDSFGEPETFAFMISLEQARAFRTALARGERVRLEAHVDAGRHDGAYQIPIGSITGSDPATTAQDIAFSCHLDHQRPGANDNASGCAVILEVARSLQRLIDDGQIERPRRTIRFIFPPEIEGTLALLVARADLADSIKAVIHMDMVGGGPETKAVFRVSRGPMSRPSFIYDISETIAAFVDAQSEAHASGKSVPFPLTATGGGQEALRPVLGQYSMGSDHQIYMDSSFGIPAIYLHDWPDRYIHTNFDRPRNIDPTKLKRAGFIGAASALVLADFSAATAASLWPYQRSQILARAAIMSERASTLDHGERDNLRYHHWRTEHAAAAAMTAWAADANDSVARVHTFIDALGEVMGPGQPLRSTLSGAGNRYRRMPEPQGPVRVFGYNYLIDKLGPETAANLTLPEYEGDLADGAAYSYEALNLADGSRSAQHIRNVLAAEFGPVPLAPVLEYLDALESIGLVERVDTP